MEDSLQLVQSLVEFEGDVQNGLKDYETKRLPRVKSVVHWAADAGDSMMGIQ